MDSVAPLILWLFSVASWGDMAHSLRISGLGGIRKKNKTLDINISLYKSKM